MWTIIADDNVASLEMDVLVMMNRKVRPDEARRYRLVRTSSFVHLKVLIWKRSRGGKAMDVHLIYICR